ncbi:hypothetical protein ACFV0D_09325 [Streptomyces sp. NPDC059556]|uniref:hypothetical protein n=1 Tax=Streptomyces sp. NPDC059556 TaxID=3346863 RepID=UPI00367BE5D5
MIGAEGGTAAVRVLTSTDDSGGDGGESATTYAVDLTSHQVTWQKDGFAGGALDGGVVIGPRTGEDRGLYDGASTYVINEYAAVGVDMNVYRDRVSWGHGRPAAVPGGGRALNACGSPPGAAARLDHPSQSRVRMVDGGSPPGDPAP